MWLNEQHREYRWTDFGREYGNTSLNTSEYTNNRSTRKHSHTGFNGIPHDKSGDY